MLERLRALDRKTIVTVAAVALVLIIGVVVLLRVYGVLPITRDEAVAAVVEIHPEFKVHAARTLPPSAIEAKEAKGGWYLAFIDRERGVPGLLSARCYFVSSTREVMETGAYNRQEGEEFNSVYTETCKPLNAPAPSGLTEDPTPPPPPPPPVATAPTANGGCYVGGCSAQLCTDQPGAMSDCQYRSEYACYREATCKRQESGQCGWTMDSELRSCLRNPPDEQ